MTVRITQIEDLVPAWMLDSISKRSVQTILRNIAAGARAEWIKIAGAELSTTKQIYIDGIQHVEMKPGQATIALTGQLPNLIEEGMDAVDMHDTLLGPKVPISPPGEFGKHIFINPKTFKSGFYRAIPFRHATPGTKKQPRGGQVGVEMGKAYTGHAAVADAKALGKEIYKKAQRLKPTTSHPKTQKTVYGGRLPAGLAPKLKAEHATDIYAGMIKERKVYEKGKGTQYITFRMISTGSPGWRRQKTPGKFFSERVNAYAQKIAPQAFKAYVDGMKGK